MSTRVLIVDDHPMIRSAIAVLLQDTDFEVTATAASVETGLETFTTNDPDIVILDLAIPGGSGVEVLRHIRGRGDKRPVIMLTAAIDDFTLREALGLDVNGIVMKDNDPGLLLDCLQSVREGRRWIDPDVEERIIQFGKEGSFTGLTPRDRKLVGLVARGLRNREIAEELGVTEGTVKVYLHAIFEKLGVSTRTELAVRVADEGLRF